MVTRLSAEPTWVLRRSPSTRVTFVGATRTSRRKPTRRSRGQWGWLHIFQSQRSLSKPWPPAPLVRGFALEFLLPPLLQTELANSPTWQTQAWHRISPNILLCPVEAGSRSASCPPNPNCWLLSFPGGDFMKMMAVTGRQNTLHTGFGCTVLENYRPSISVTHSRNCKAIYFHQLHLIKNTQQKCTDTLHEK